MREVRHGTDRNHRDTGAIDSVVPRSILEGVGLRPRAEPVYTLADGGEVRMQTTTCDVEILGEITGGTIVFAGDDNGIPPLGATAMQSAGIEVDPRNEQLRRLPAISLR